MRINLPGFSHANYIVFLIIQQEFPSPLAFNYTLTRYFSPASFWAATCGESPWCVIITEGRGQRCCRTALQLGKAMATSGIYVTDLLISARETSLLKAHSVPTLLAHFDTDFQSKFSSTIFSFRSAEEKVAKSTQRATDPPKNSIQAKQAIHYHSCSPDSLGAWWASLFI